MSKKNQDVCGWVRGWGGWGGP